MRRTYISPIAILIDVENEELLVGSPIDITTEDGPGTGDNTGDGEGANWADSKGGNDGFLFGDDEDEIGGGNKPWWRR